MTNIAVDAMGGDFAPSEPVRAVADVASKRPDVTFTVIGNIEKIRAVGVTFPKNVELVEAPTVIDADDEPVRAVRRKKDSSLVIAAGMVRDGVADVMISAGNTGALVAAGLLVIGRLPGIDRPALAPVLPTFNRKGVLLLDAGATVDATPENLEQFAQMGQAYSRYVLQVDRPKVGLLNVGTEEGKGNALAKAAYTLLKDARDIQFIGNIEARDLLNGECDVVVCDGFDGNIVLKLSEGIGIGMFQALRETLLANWKNKFATMLLKPSLRAFRDRFDYVEYGGAPLLGLTGGCFKAHGSSNERAWKVTLEQALRFTENRLVEKIASGLSQSKQG